MRRADNGGRRSLAGVVNSGGKGEIIGNPSGVDQAYRGKSAVEIFFNTGEKRCRMNSYTVRRQYGFQRLSASTSPYACCHCALYAAMLRCAQAQDEHLGGIIWADLRTAGDIYMVAVPRLARLASWRWRNAARRRCWRRRL